MNIEYFREEDMEYSNWTEFFIDKTGDEDGA